MNEKVVWFESMLLRPQHFQQQERFLLDVLKSSLKSIAPYQWGVRRVEFDKDLLNAGAIGISRCEGILPDGTPFCLDRETDAGNLPTPLKLESGTNNLRVFLGLPGNSWVAGVNLIDGVAAAGGPGSGTLARYEAETKEVSDDNFEFKDAKKKIQVGRSRFELLSGDAEGYATLPIARIKQVSGKLVVLDEAFIPPCLDINQIPGLHDRFVGALERELALCITNHAEWLSRSNARGYKEIDALLSLQALNRFKLWLEQRKTDAGWHPHQLYHALLALFAELSTTKTKTRTPGEVPRYRHDDLEHSFMVLAEELTRLLKIPLDVDEEEIPMRLLSSEGGENSHARYAAAITPRFRELILGNARFYLTAKIPADKRAAFVKQYFISEAKHLRILLEYGGGGIKLEPRTTPPQGIDCDENTTCFLLSSDLDQPDSHWRKVVDSKFGLEIHVKFGPLAEGDLRLWAVKNREAATGRPA